jgi:hypothetical protein
MRWRQADFDQAEYRRSFARSVVTKAFRGFRSIQASPVGGPRLKEELKRVTTWITGTTAFGDNTRLAQPNGTIELTFHAEEAPPAWKMLCGLFGEGHRHAISIPAGGWYRMRCSIELNIDNGLL